jgi:hypothetical protein
MRVALLPSAWDDLAAAFRFYENQQAGLGDYFRESLIAEIEPLGSDLKPLRIITPRTPRAPRCSSLHAVARVAFVA